MKKDIYILEILCDKEEDLKEFERWFINLIIKINVKTIDKNIILESAKLYGNVSVSIE